MFAVLLVEIPMFGYQLLIFSCSETKRKERCCYISIGIILLAVLASTAFVVVHFLVLSVGNLILTK